MNPDDVKLIDPLKDRRWDEFVSNHPYSSIYQHSSWIKVLGLTYKHVRPLCFVLEDEKYNIRAAIPCSVVKSKLMGIRIVSLPFTSFSDPLIENNIDFIRLLDELINHLKNISASYCELRCFKSLDLIEDRRLKQHNYHKIQILDIEGDFERISRSFHKDCIIRSAKKSIRCGVEIRQGSSEQDLKKFYSIHAMTRRRQGFPIQPYRFFKNMWEIMNPLGYYCLLLAEFKRKTIAGAVLFKFKDVVSFEHGASIPKYLPLRPNHLVMWNAIKIACSEGYRFFDFGKTTPENKGLLDFKRRWGAKTFSLPYFYYPEIKGMMSIEQSDLKHRVLSIVGKNMPLPLAKILGRAAYHHLG